MDISALIRDFAKWDIGPLLPFRSVLSTQTSDGDIFPPYVPLIGKEYEHRGCRLLIYGTAQSITWTDQVQRLYADHYEDGKLAERLYYDSNFERKYPSHTLPFFEVRIRPYQAGVLPALAGLFLRKVCGERLYDFEEIQNRIAVTNYYKFSLCHTGEQRGINPNDLKKYRPNDYRAYWKIADDLVYRELETVKPTHIITFKGRHVDVLKTKVPSVMVINDPAWILRGGGGVFGPSGSWTKRADGVRDADAIQMVEDYLEHLLPPYLGALERVRKYILKYQFDWQEKM